MFLAPVANGIEVLAPAKLNLFLEVLGRRPDGFHEIETFMVAVGIWDRLRFESIERSEVTVSCEVASGWRARERAVEGDQALTGAVPEGRQNLVFQAVEHLRRAARVRQGARIQLRKQISAAAGLGGGSSDAAAALLAANRAWHLHWPLHRLSRLAAEIGSDVPFFLKSAPAICRGRGELLEEIPMNCPFFVVVVRPPVGLDTAAVYRHCQPARQPISVQPLLAALRQGDLTRLARLMNNRLQSAAAELSPWITELRDVFRQLDCVGHQMSGSGSSYFGICRHRQHARRVAARLRGQGFGYVRVASTLARCDLTQLASSQP
jgi:4-diphosphocytidyl-2-C-methyl-D-erythritol kinase